MPLIDSYCVSFVSILLSAQNRKHCAICKCPRDVHDVTHKESVNVHDRLGLNKEGEEEHQHRHQHQQQQHPQLPASSSRVMPLNKGARPTSSDVYSWIPAGLTPDQVKYSPTGGEKYKYFFSPPLSSLPPSYRRLGKGWRIVLAPADPAGMRNGGINPDTLNGRRRRLFLYLH
jgi:hypothetical protein